MSLVHGSVSPYLHSSNHSTQHHCPEWRLQFWTPSSFFQGFPENSSSSLQPFLPTTHINLPTCISLQFKREAKIIHGTLVLHGTGEKVSVYKCLASKECDSLCLAQELKIKVLLVKDLKGDILPDEQEEKRDKWEGEREKAFGQSIQSEERTTPWAILTEWNEDYRGKKEVVLRRSIPWSPRILGKSDL